MKRFAIVLLTLGVLALASTPALARGYRTSHHGGHYSSHYSGHHGGHYNWYPSYYHGGGHHYRPHVSYHYSPHHSSFGYHGRGFSFSFCH